MRGFGRNFAQDDRVSLLLDARLDAVRSDGTHGRVLDALGNQSRVRGELLNLVELRDHHHGDAHVRVHLGHQEAVRLQILFGEVKLDLCFVLKTRVRAAPGGGGKMPHNAWRHGHRKEGKEGRWPSRADLI